MTTRTFVSLPYDILDIIGELIARSASLKAAGAYDGNPFDFDYRPPGFRAFFAARRDRNKTPYSTRLVCKLFNEILVKYLFRDIHIRLGWDWLHVNPPLCELGLELPGVLQQNARHLQISPLYRHPSSFCQDDVEKDNIGLNNLPLGAYTAYPPFKSGHQKWKEHKDLVTELKMWLNPVITSFSNVTFVSWDIFNSGHDFLPWYQADVISALSYISGLTRLDLRIHQQGGTSNTAVFAEIIIAMGRMLRLTHLAIQIFGWVPSDYNHFWQFMKTTGINLISLSVNVLDMPLLEYISRYTGLRSLSFQLDRPQGSNTIVYPRTTSDVIFSYLFQVALPQHYSTLESLRLPNIDPSLYKMVPSRIQETNYDFLSTCNLLRSLSFPVMVGKIEKIKEDFTRVMTYACSLPLLDELHFDVHSQALYNVIPPGHSTISDIICDILSSKFEYTGFNRLPKVLHVRGGASYILEWNSDGMLRYSKQN